MADNSKQQDNDSVRTIDRSGVKTPVAVIDVGGTASEALIGDGTNKLPVDTELTTADLNTGAGTDTRAVVGLVSAENGGGVLVGSATPLPVTGSVTASVSGSVSVSGNVGILTWQGNNVDTNSGNKSAGTLRVVIATDQPSLSNALTVTSTASGPAAEDAALSGNPLRMGVRASAAVPTAMSADGDIVTPWADKSGRSVVKQQSGTGTTSQVSDTNVSTTILAANTARLGASVFNDSTVTLYLKMGTTASTTDYTVQLVAGAYWEAPYGYTGKIDGIWASDPNTGAARVTEYT